MRTPIRKSPAPPLWITDGQYANSLVAQSFPCMNSLFFFSAVTWSAKLATDCLVTDADWHHYSVIQPSTDSSLLLRSLSNAVLLLHTRTRRIRMNNVKAPLYGEKIYQTSFHQNRKLIRATVVRILGENVGFVPTKHFIRDEQHLMCRLLAPTLKWPPVSKHIGVSGDSCCLNDHSQTP